MREGDSDEQVGPAAGLAGTASSGFSIAALGPPGALWLGFSRVEGGGRRESEGERRRVPACGRTLKREIQHGYASSF